MMERITIALLSFALLLVGCARETQTPFPTDGKAEGTLTINDKKYPLKHVYAGKKKSSDGESWSMEVLVSTEPLSYDTLSKIFLELEVDSYLRKEREALKGDSIKALYFRMFGYEIESGIRQGFTDVEFHGLLITSDDFFDYQSYAENSDTFDQFSFKDGRVTAKAKSKKWEQTTWGETITEEIKIAAEFEVSFEAQVKEESLLSRSFSAENKEWQKTLATLPEEGTAQGTVTISKNVINVAHAYAIRGNVEGVGEVITVLLADKSIKKELLLFSLKRAVPYGMGLYLYIDKAGALQNSAIKCSNACGMAVGESGYFEETTIKNFRIENGRVKGSVENREKPIREDDTELDSYSVSFDAPLR